MKRSPVLPALLVGVSTLLAWPVAHATADAAWRARMAELSGAITQLLPDVASEERFEDPKNRARIIKNAEVIGRLAHDTASAPNKPQPDPTIATMGSLMAEEANEAAWAIRAGNMRYARGVLLNVANACIACHSRNQEGPQFPLPANFPNEAALRPLERATLHAAMRRYEQAMPEFLAIIEDKEAPAKAGLDWQRAVHAALITSVRVQRDPVMALRIATAVEKAPFGPRFMARDATAWRTAIEAWQAEKVPTATTEDGMLSRARALLAEVLAIPAQRRGALGAIQLLRASSILHDLVSTYPNGPQVGQAFAALGACYEELAGMEQWTLQLMFYDACIRAAPNTDTSRGCFAQYEADVNREFLTTASNALPADMAKRIAELRALSQ